MTDLSEKKCVACCTPIGNDGLIVIYDPSRPRGSKKKNHIMGYHCDNNKCRIMAMDILYTQKRVDE